jgi:hypothetical protein
MLKIFLLLIRIFVFWIPLDASAEFLKRSSHYTLKMSKSSEEAESKAGIVFQGRLLDSKNYEENGLRIRELKFKIEKSIKGLSHENEEIIIKEWAAARNDFLAREDRHESFIFYFYSPSDLGLSSLIKMTPAEN